VVYAIVFLEKKRGAVYAARAAVSSRGMGMTPSEANDE
jgi:hypothetical protein